MMIDDDDDDGDDDDDDVDDDVEENVDDDDDDDDNDSFPFLLFFAFSRNVGRFRVNIMYAGDSDDADQT